MRRNGLGLTSIIIMVAQQYDRDTLESKKAPLEDRRTVYGHIVKRRPLLWLLITGGPRPLLFVSVFVSVPVSLFVPVLCFLLVSFRCSFRKMALRLKVECVIGALGIGIPARKPIDGDDQIQAIACGYPVDAGTDASGAFIYGSSSKRLF